MEHLWRKTRVVAGHVSQLPREGSFITFERLGASVVRNAASNHLGRVQRCDVPMECFGLTHCVRRHQSVALPSDMRVAISSNETFRLNDARPQDVVPGSRDPPGARDVIPSD
jgi:hypothetical protein